MLGLPRLSGRGAWEQRDQSTSLLPGDSAACAPGQLRLPRLRQPGLGLPWRRQCDGAVGSLLDYLFPFTWELCSNLGHCQRGAMSVPVHATALADPDPVTWLPSFTSDLLWKPGLLFDPVLPSLALLRTFVWALWEQLRSLACLLPCHGSGCSWQCKPGCSHCSWQCRPAHLGACTQLWGGFLLINVLLLSKWQRQNWILQFFLVHV